MAGNIAGRVIAGRTADTLPELTPAQELAATDDSQYLEIVAGPGTGKTHTLAHRIADFVQSRGIPTNEIVAFTFTNSAAATLRARLIKLLGSEIGSQIFVTTYHGFGHYLASTYGSKDYAQLIAGWTVADEWDQKLLTRNLAPHSLLRHWFLSRVAERHSPHKRPRISRPWSPGIGPQQLQGDLKTYKDRLAVAKMLDYDDLLDVGLAVSQTTDTGFRHVFADEFQDVTYLQWLMVWNILQKSPDCTLSVVGDVNQGIFNFSNTKVGPDAYDELHRRLPIKQVFLDRNFRSTQAIVHLAEGIIGKALPASTRGSGERPLLIRYPSHEMMRMHLPSVVRQVIAKTGSVDSSVAVLAYTNVEVYMIREYLQKNGINAGIGLAKALLQMSPVQVASTLLKYALSPVNPHLIYLLMNPVYNGLTAGAMDLASRASSNLTTPLRPVLLSEEVLTALRRTKRDETLKEFLDYLDSTSTELIELRDFSMLRKIAWEFIQKAQGLFPSKRRETAAAPVESLNKFFDSIEAQIEAELDIEQGLSDEPVVARAVRLISNLEAAQRDGVSVRTMHSSKGEEFAHVVLALDGTKRYETNIAYVAATRARDSLVVCSTDPVPTRFKLPSEYIETKRLYENTLRGITKAAPSLYSRMDLSITRFAAQVPAQMVNRSRFITTASHALRFIRQAV